MFRLRAGPSNAQTVKLPPQHEGELGAGPFAHRSTIVAIGGALTYLPRGSLWAEGGQRKGVRARIGNSGKLLQSGVPKGRCPSRLVNSLKSKRSCRIFIHASGAAVSMNVFTAQEELCFEYRNTFICFEEPSEESALSVDASQGSASQI